MGDFTEERNKAFLSMDKDEILTFCKNHNIEIPEEEEVLWAGVHKVICELFMYEDSPVSIDQYNDSYDWLVSKGYTPYVAGGNE